MSAGQFDRRVFLKAAGGAAVGGRLYADTDRDQAPLGANDFVMTDLREDGRLPEAPAADLAQWAALITSNITASTA